MELHIVIQGRKNLAIQLYEQLRLNIESGQLAPGVQLPPSRLLATRLGLSRKTVSDTYSRLTYEHVLVTKTGSGTFVNAAHTPVLRAVPDPNLASLARVHRWQSMALPLRHPGLNQTLRWDFIGGATAKAHFPHDDWRRCTLYALRQMAQARGFYSQAQGLPELRAAIAGHVAFARGVKCVADQIVVCNGAQQALDLLAKVLIEPGCTVAMEDPGYLPARLLFTAQGANVVGVAVDNEGLVVDGIPDDAHVIYVTPSHQMPLGMPMSLARRQALLDKAQRIGAVVIEDDYDSDFRYEGAPVDALQSLDQRGAVAYVGTFSKTLLPEHRLGYVVLPSPLVQAVVNAKQLTDWHTCTVSQWTLTKFMSEGLLNKHIRRNHATYIGRRERILARLSSDLAPWLDAIPSTAGFHIAALLRVDIDLPQLVDQARQVGLGLYPLTAFHADTPVRNGLMLGFGAIETLDIDPALDCLRGLLAELA